MQRNDIIWALKHGRDGQLLDARGPAAEMLKLDGRQGLGDAGSRRARLAWNLEHGNIHQLRACRAGAAEMLTLPPTQPDLCPVCSASGDDPCLTASGRKRSRRHAER